MAGSATLRASLASSRIQRVDTIGAFFVLDSTGDETVEAIYLDAIERVWVPDKPEETLWP